MRTRRRVVCAAAVLAACAFGAVGGSAAAAEKTVTVDCAKGDRVQKALEDKADTLIVEIVGTCVEDVVVRRRAVTLRGSDPATDGIRAADGSNPVGAAILVDDAGDVTIENLTISGGGRDGLTFQESGLGNLVRNCRVEGNARFGVTSFSSVVELRDVVVTGNGRPCSGGGGTGILSFANSSLICTDCTISGNGGGDPVCDLGVSAGTGASASLVDSSVEGNPAVQATPFGRLFVTSSLLTGLPLAVVSNRHGQATITGGTIAGSLRADAKSLLNLTGQPATGPVVQTANPAGNLVLRDAMLETNPGTVLVGHTTIELFGQAIFRGTTLGTLDCDGSSEALCRGATTHAGSTCSACP